MYFTFSRWWFLQLDLWQLSGCFRRHLLRHSGLEEAVTAEGMASLLPPCMSLHSCPVENKVTCTHTCMCTHVGVCVCIMYIYERRRVKSSCSTCPMDAHRGTEMNYKGRKLPGHLYLQGSWGKRWLSPPALLIACLGVCVLSPQFSLSPIDFPTTSPL